VPDTQTMDARIIRYSEQPELWEGWFGDGSGEVWPEYNQHGEELNAYWGRLYEVFPEWQFLLYDDGQEVILAEGHTIPLVWDGDEATLGPGIDVSVAEAFAARDEGAVPTVGNPVDDGRERVRQWSASDRPEEVRPITATAVRVLTAHGDGSARRHPERQTHALHLGEHL
jgi:hypothetical protein